MLMILDSYVDDSYLADTSSIGSACIWISGAGESAVVLKAGYCEKITLLIFLALSAGRKYFSSTESNAILNVLHNLHIDQMLNNLLDQTNKNHTTEITIHVAFLLAKGVKQSDNFPETHVL